MSTVLMILLLLIMVPIILIIHCFLVIYASRSPFLQWWNKWKKKGGTGAISSSTAAVTQQEKLDWWYILGSELWEGIFFDIYEELFVSKNMQINSNWLSWLINECSNYQAWDTGDDYGGLLTPRSYAVGLIPSYGCGDRVFDEWVDKYYNKIHKERKGGVNKEIWLEYDDKGFRKNGGIFPEPPTMGSITNTFHWKCFILELLNGYDATIKDPIGLKADPKSKDYNWCFGEMQGQEGDVKFYGFYLTTKGLSPGSSPYDIWYSAINTTPDESGRPPRNDNFFSRFGMSPTSALITAFFNDNFTIDQNYYHSKNFGVLLNRTDDGSIGGLYGYLMTMKDQPDMSESWINDWFQQSIEGGPYIPPSPPKCKRNNEAGALAGITSGISTAVSGTMLLPFLPGGGAAAGAAAAGAAVAEGGAATVASGGLALPIIGIGIVAIAMGAWTGDKAARSC